ncbi:hypothetical protein [Mastigocladopsis repens]|nr:hypothetical protein [Mastigocladopsis repens]
MCHHLLVSRYGGLQGDRFSGWRWKRSLLTFEYINLGENGNGGIGEY